MVLSAWGLSGEEWVRGYPRSGSRSALVRGAAQRGVSRGWCWCPCGHGQTKLALQPREVKESGFAAYGNSSSVYYC